IGLPDDIVEIGRTARGHLSPFQRNQVCFVKKGYEDRAVQLQQELREPCYSREALRDELYAVELIVAACNGLLSHLRLFPLEVMEIIFQFCLKPRNEILDGVTEANSNEQPPTNRAVLSQVCHWWRDAILSSPSLWSPVSISAGQHIHSETSMVAGLAVPHLLREIQLAKPCPWSLQIDARGCPMTDPLADDDLAYRPYKEPLVKLLKEEPLFTLRKLRVRCDDADTTFQGITLPSLDSLVLRWSGSDWRTRQERETPSLPIMPCLTKAVLSGIPHQFFELPCSRLTHLYIGGFGLNLETWLQIMVACTSLYRGCFSIDSDPRQEGAQPANYPHIVSQHYLQELVIISPDGFEPKTMFHWPSLRTLKSYFGWNPWEHWAPHFNHTNRLLDCFPFLTCLWFSGKEDVAFMDVLAPILDTCHSLEELSLHITATENVSTVQYFNRQQRSMTLPRLRALGLRVPLWEEWGKVATEQDTSDQVKHLCSLACDMIVSRVALQGLGSDAPLEDFVLRLDHDGENRIIAKHVWKAMEREVRLRDCADRIRVAIVPVQGHNEVWQREDNDHTIWGHWDEDFVNCMDTQSAFSPYPQERDRILFQV
ncbi:hypothetical protein BKA70DRAFT_1328954, partial [Coprinopsis sp. MPI-PUGE-AT-0042]